jgi:hypothetical protein
MTRPCTISKEHQLIIASEKYSVPELSRELGINSSTIHSYIKRKKINVPKRFSMGKTVKDHNIFKIWNSDMAYLAGFILADGYVHFNPHSRGYKVDITLARKDRGHLEKLRKLVGTSSSIQDYEREHPISRLLIYSKTIYYDLINIGITPNKTFTAKWMDNWPDEFIPDLVRGFFDGDGCIHIRKYKNRPQDSIMISFTGTKSMMEGVQNSFSNYYGNKNRYCL